MRAGMTLLEVLLSVAILGIILGVTAPALFSLYHRNDLEADTLAVVSAIRRAQSLAIAGTNDSSWGVSVGTSSVLVFKGATYAARDQGFDETTPYGTTLAAAGTLQMVFSEQGGTTTPATTTLTSQNGDVRTIVTNLYGTVSY